MALRITSLDYLGAVASKLRRDAVQSRLKLDTINSIIKYVLVFVYLIYKIQDKSILFSHILQENVVSCNR